MVCGRLVQQRPCKGLCRYYDGGGFGWSRQESQPGGPGEDATGAGTAGYRDEVSHPTCQDDPSAVVASQLPTQRPNATLPNSSTYSPMARLHLSL